MRIALTEKFPRRTVSLVAGRNSLIDDRVALALEEYAAAQDASAPISRESLLAKYADVADELIGCLDSLDFIRHVAPQLNDNAQADSGNSSAVRPVAALGDFRIVCEIGRGGMGVVYEAEQLSLGRPVALKVLPFAAMLDKQQLARFKNEARAAATLDHPNIVAIYSVGVERGVHYYAMQLIDGQSLAQMIGVMRQKQESGGTGEGSGVRGQESGADDQKSPAHPLTPSPAHSSTPSPAHTPAPDTVPHAALSTIPAYDTREYCRTIAELGIQAAEALDHAHQNGIIHRDVKPANLLIDETGKLWVTDFGLARLEADAGMTMTGDIVGTLRYMSPEQALAKRVVIDHRTDIYSLGVTLYELLTLRPVFEGDDRQQLLHQIAVDEPPPPRQIDPRIPRDLETIVQKAICKEAVGRYQTASQLADDLRRYLDHKPIQARRPTRAEQLVKWSRRHPSVVWATALVLLTTTMTSAVSTWEAIRATRAERQAKASEQLALQNSRRADAISDFLINSFRSPDPELDGRTVTIAEVLDRAVKEAQEKFTEDPHTKAAVLQAIGDSYEGLGLYHESIPLFEEVYKLSTEQADFSGALQAMMSLENMYAQVGNHDHALELSEKVLRLAQAKLGPKHHTTLNAMGNLAMSYEDVGRHQEALELEEKAFELKKANLGPDDPDTLTTAANLGKAYFRAGRLQDGIKLLEETLQRMKATLGADSGKTRDTTQTLADCYCEMGLHKQAIPLLEALRDSCLRRLGPTHPLTLSSMDSLADALRGAGRLKEAIALSEKTVELCEAHLDPADGINLNAIINLATAYRDAEEFDKAVPLYEKAYNIGKSVPNHPDMLALTMDLGQGYAHAERFEAAVPLLEKVVESQRADRQLGAMDTILALNYLAQAYQRIGRLDDALPLLREVVTRRTAASGQDDPETLGAQNHLVELLILQGKLAEAAPIAREVVAALRARCSDDCLRLAIAQSQLAIIFLGQGKFADAEDAARASLAIYRQNFPDEVLLSFSQGLLGGSLLEQQKLTEAEPILNAACDALKNRKGKISIECTSYEKDLLRRLIRLFEATDQVERIGNWKKSLDQLNTPATR